jgi:hypothetical protein
VDLSCSLLDERAATEQAVDICHTLRMMGVPMFFGNNKSAFTSSTTPHGCLARGTTCSLVIDAEKRLLLAFPRCSTACGWKEEPERCDDKILGAQSVLSFGQTLSHLEGTC